MQGATRFLMTISLWGWLTVSCSADAPVVIASGEGALAPLQPQAAVHLDGSVSVVFGIGDQVHFARSATGQGFNVPVRAFQVPNLSLGMRRGPRIAVTKEAIVVTAIGGEMGHGKDGDLLAWHSTNQGKSWTGPVRVNDVLSSAREGLHAMASGEDGTVWCTWLDLRDRKSELYAARSTDGGATWSTNRRVYQSPDGDVCPCCHPSVTVDQTGVHFLFRNSLDGNRDMYLTSTTDQGHTFTPAVRLGSGTWMLDACPMDGGMLTSRNGQIETVWRRKGNIYAVSAGGDEQLLGTGQQPWIAATAQGAMIVWTTGRQGELMVRRPGATTAERLARVARDPVLATSTVASSPVFCCWESREGAEVSVVVQRLDSHD